MGTFDSSRLNGSLLFRSISGLDFILCVLRFNFILVVSFFHVCSGILLFFELLSSSGSVTSSALFCLLLESLLFLG